jgi:hypothetical protein
LCTSRTQRCARVVHSVSLQLYSCSLAHAVRCGNQRNRAPANVRLLQACTLFAVCIDRNIGRVCDRVTPMVLEPRLQLHSFRDTQCTTRSAELLTPVTCTHSRSSAPSDSNFQPGTFFTLSLRDLVRFYNFSSKCFLSGLFSDMVGFIRH